MFNIDQTPTFNETIKVVAPDGQASDFGALFLALDIDAFNGFDLGTSDGARAFLDATLQRVDDIIDSVGRPVPDTPDLRARLIALPWVRPALIRGYLEGVGRAAQGN